MAARVLLHLGDATNKCFFSNIQFHRTKFQVQNILKQNRNFRRVRSVEQNTSPSFTNCQIQDFGASNGRNLLKAFVFASTFSGATFVAASILEYERVRSETSKRFNKFHYSPPFRKTTSGWRSQIRSWWRGLSEGQQLFYYICYANVMVFLAWKIPRYQSTMMKYFATSTSSNVICLPMLLATFSHYNLLHLAANMYVLHSFSTAAVGSLGKEHFLAVYLSSGVIASFFSNAYKIMLNRNSYSLGASGAIMGILAYICTRFPETKLGIILLPQITFSAKAAIQSLMAFDAAGCLLGWRVFDHAAHLGGAFFGIFWQTWGIENIWRQRMSILTYWHELRNPRK